MDLPDPKSELLEKLRDLRERQQQYERGDYHETHNFAGRIPFPLVKTLTIADPLQKTLQTYPMYLRQCDLVLDAPDNHESSANYEPVPPLNVKFTIKAEQLSENEDIDQVVSEIMTHLGHLKNKISYMRRSGYQVDRLDSVRDALRQGFSFFDEVIAPDSDASLTDKARISLIKLEKQYLEIKLAEILEKSRQLEIVINESKKEFRLGRPAHYYAIRAADLLFDSYMEMLDRDARLNRSAINLPKPVGKILHEKGYPTLRDIVKLKYHEIIAISGIGHSRIDTITQYFRESGLPKPLFAFQKEISVHPEYFDFVRDVRYEWRARLEMDHSEPYAWALPKLYRPFSELKFELDGRPHLRVTLEDPNPTDEAPKS